MAFPSTFADIQSAVIAKLGLDSTTDLAKTKDWVNQAYADVAVETETLQDSATLALTANVSSYTLPSAIIRIKYITAASASSSISYGPPLRVLTMDEILSNRQSNGATQASTTGTVEGYAMVGLTELELWPTPALADTLLLYYVKLPTALSLGTDVPVFQEPWATDLLEYGACIKAAEFLQRWDVAGETRTLYRDAMRRFRTHLNRRDGGGPQQIRVKADYVPMSRDRSADVVR